ncbi:hypothetical protein MF621_004017 (plasmid) [Bacillus velezensis]|uniref:hypothetical protein n=1 Tax=Bacillus velezensis TaxID=492670 RepID=UPI00202552F2|nr:hypothetical protein [Bacillus velezensis]URJ76312.1 hypothetical protein MF619_004055 [Bacillus velezensis]URJ80432.1 hypothetical protein MF621_004017 [Bacillus velezensis]
MKSVTFKIPCRSGENKTIKGYLFNVDGVPYDFVVHRNLQDDEWTTSELTSGMKLTDSHSFRTRGDAIEYTRNLLKKDLIKEKLINLVDSSKKIN